MTTDRCSNDEGRADENRADENRADNNGADNNGANNNGANNNGADDTSRRSFLLSGGGLLTSAWIAAQWPALTAAAHHADQMPMDTVPAHFAFFDAADGADVAAIAAQIIPSDATPGAREARAVYFIDRVLSTDLAYMAAGYRAGLVDFQSKYHDVAVKGNAAKGKAAKVTAGESAAGDFAACDANAQIAFLHTVDQTAFFDATRMLTVLGMFSSPKYGGNYQGLGWKMMGFVDQHAFTPPFGYYDREYTGFVPYPSKAT